MCVCVCLSVSHNINVIHISNTVMHTHMHTHKDIHACTYLCADSCCPRHAPGRCDARGAGHNIHISHMFMYTFIRLHYNMHVFHIHIHVCAQDVAPPEASVGGARGTAHNTQKYIYHTHTFMRILTYTYTSTYISTITFIYQIFTYIFVRRILLPRSPGGRCARDSTQYTNQHISHVYTFMHIFMYTCIRIPTYTIICIHCIFTNTFVCRISLPRKPWQAVRAGQVKLLKSLIALEVTIGNGYRANF